MLLHTELDAVAQILSWMLLHTELDAVADQVEFRMPAFDSSLLRHPHCHPDDRVTASRTLMSIVVADAQHALELAKVGNWPVG